MIAPNSLFLCLLNVLQHFIYPHLKLLNEPSHRYFLIDIVVSLKTYDRFGESFRNFFNYLETFIST